MTYRELYSHINKPWANVKDIQNIASCGKNKASKIRDDIITKILQNGKNVPQAKEKIVPMELVIEYLNLDLNYIFQMAKKEKEIMT